ncbi:MAG TPA: LysR family transcriptional regulator [Burkholderiaceae bacterium]|jgi:DNA-binding transcriptional LysR family regulator
MKLQSLQTLASVLRHGSFAAAAKEVSLTASAVSLQMRQLESYFGQPLFDRSARHVRPTPFALEVAQSLQPTLATLVQLRGRRAPTVSGHVRLGTIESVQVTLLPLAMQTMRARAPGLGFQITRGLSSALLDDVKAGRLDAAVIVRPQSGGSSRLSWHPLMRENFVMIAPPAAVRGTPAELLRRHEWIRFDPATTGGLMATQWVNRIAPGLKPAFDLPGMEAIAAMVSAGLGVSVVPVLRRELVEMFPLRQLALGRTAPVRHVALVCRKADADSRRLQTVLDAFHGAVHARYADAPEVRPAKP